MAWPTSYRYGTCTVPVLIFLRTNSEDQEAQEVQQAQQAQQAQDASETEQMRIIE